MILIFGCQEEVDKKISLDPAQSMQRMADSIQKIYENINVEACLYENERRLKLYLDEVEKTQGKNPQALFKAAIEALNNGDTQLSIDLIKDIQQLSPLFKEVNKKAIDIHKFLAIAYMRLGEQTNCIHNHNDQSCIVPIQEKGIHEDRTGSSLAIEKYLEVLEVMPDDFESKWLLNIAYMTLGKYPADVPEKYLIPIESESPVIGVENIATRTGLDHFGLSGGVIADDFNNDGLLDLIMSSWGSEGTIQYFQNMGPEGFKDLTEQSGLDKAKGGLNIKQADYNNDGFLDFFILRGAWKLDHSWGITPNSLIRNNGDGTFSDVTFEAGLYSLRPTQTGEWFDYNNDGWLDLFIANEKTPMTEEDFSCELFKNNGDGTFSNVSDETGASIAGYFKGVVAGDINNDGYQDLFISNMSGPNKLLLNHQGPNGDRKFKDIASTAGVELPFAAFPAWFFDYNNDGWQDLFVATYDRYATRGQAGQFAREKLKQPIMMEASKLYINNGDNTFTSYLEEFFQSKAVATMGSNFEDFNGDGYPDIYLGTGAPDYRAIVPNRFFENIGGTDIRELTMEMGVGHIQKGHGVSFADLNNDGSLDLYVVMGGAFKGDKFPNALFENPGHGNSWIKFSLIGDKSNRSAIGARIRLIASDEKGDTLTFHKTIGSGSSFGANPFLATFGLGKMSKIVELAVNWPNQQNTYQEIKGDFKIGQLYELAEGKAARKLPHNSFPFKKDAEGHHHHHPAM